MPLDSGSPIGRLWLLLDDAMDRIMEAGEESDKQEARGIALCLQSLLPFMSIDDVREYASYRYDARQEGLESIHWIEWAGLK